MVDIDNFRLGAMKNEYPLDGDINSTSIQKLVVMNKKIYQYMISDKWNNKFKGCKHASDDMF